MKKCCNGAAIQFAQFSHHFQTFIKFALDIAGLCVCTEIFRTGWSQFMAQRRIAIIFQSGIWYAPQQPNCSKTAVFHQQNLWHNSYKGTTSSIC
jgi:hypothetical protein